MANVLITQGTQSPVATDLVGTVNYQIVKLDFGTAGTTNLFGGTSNPLPTTLNTGIAGEDLTNQVLGVLTKPIGGTNIYSPSEFTSFGAASGTGVAVKASAGNLYSAHVTSTSGSIRYFQVFNSATALANGGTPVASYPLGSVASGAVAELKLDTGHFSPSRYFSTGIAIAISSTNGTLGTASVTASEHNIHLKYV